MRDGGWFGGLLILVVFLAVMQSCQPEDPCDTPTSDYHIEQCELERP